MDRWEYRRVRLTGENFLHQDEVNAELDRHGAHGWDLVGFQLIGSEHPLLDQVYVFRRRVVDDGRASR